MDSVLDYQLNIRLSSEKVLKLIFDENTPRKFMCGSEEQSEDLNWKIELISEDRERLRKECQDLLKERNGLFVDIINRKKIHEELLNHFSKINSKTIKELEKEAKVLQEVFIRKSDLLEKMRGLLKSPEKKTHHREIFSKRTVDFEKTVKTLVIRDSLSPVKPINTSKWRKKPVMIKSFCN